ncbi:hypothetical protein BG005_008047 [Podila minutissima]|nr:hypothetical protein BG005_008047 [Podila minutissima]
MSTPTSDSSALLLDKATRQQSSALTSFTLDITLLSKVGFMLVQIILYRSRLEPLSIHCTPIDQYQKENIHRLLQSVHWSLLASLVLFGYNLNEWIQLLTENTIPFLTNISSDAHRLLRFGLYGARCLENTELKDK